MLKSIMKVFAMFLHAELHLPFSRLKIKVSFEDERNVSGEEVEQVWSLKC